MMMLMTVLMISSKMNREAILTVDSLSLACLPEETPRGPQIDGEPPSGKIIDPAYDSKLPLEQLRVSERITGITSISKEFVF